MALLPDTNFVTRATGEIFSQFLYFSRPITIYKSAQETLINPAQNYLLGYSPLSQSNNSQVTLSGESQIFSGLVISPLKARGNSNSMFDNKINLENNKTYIKVTNSAHEYVRDNKIEKLEVDGITYNLEGAAQTAYYLGLVFYYYQIQATN